MTYGDDQRHYAHPDHLKVHDITLPAFDRAGDPDWYPEAGEPWQPLKLYYTEWSPTRIHGAARQVRGARDRLAVRRRLDRAHPRRRGARPHHHPDRHRGPLPRARGGAAGARDPGRPEGVVLVRPADRGRPRRPSLRRLRAGPVAGRSDARRASRRTCSPACPVAGERRPADSDRGGARAGRSSRCGRRRRRCSSCAPPALPDESLSARRPRRCGPAPPDGARRAGGAAPMPPLVRCADGSHLGVPGRGRRAGRRGLGVADRRRSGSARRTCSCWWCIPLAVGAGVARTLVGAAESWALAHGSTTLTVGAGAPFYLFTGVDTRWTEALCCFEALGLRAGRRPSWTWSARPCRRVERRRRRPARHAVSSCPTSPTTVDAAELDRWVAGALPALGRGVRPGRCCGHRRGRPADDGAAARRSGALGEPLRGDRAGRGRSDLPAGAVSAPG